MTVTFYLVNNDGNCEFWTHHFTMAKTFNEALEMAQEHQRIFSENSLTLLKVEIIKCN